jgi:hypothetical protein
MPLLSNVGMEYGGCSCCDFSSVIQHSAETMPGRARAAGCEMESLMADHHADTAGSEV